VKKKNAPATFLPTQPQELILMLKNLFLMSQKSILISQNLFLMPQNLILDSKLKTQGEG
jgi:hypothetical protein